MGSGLIFAAVVIAWAAFLVPWALRRYEEATRTRSVDKVSKAIRILARSKDPARKGSAEDEEPVATSPALSPHAAEGVAPVQSPRLPSRTAARVAAARRRRVLSILVVLTAVAGVLAVLAIVPTWAVAVPAGLVVAFVALCRWQVRREDDATWARRRAEPSEAADPEEASEAPDRSDDEPTVVFPAAAEARDRARGRQAVEADADPVAEEHLVESTAVAVSVSTDDGHSLWDPLPVTLPTYVSKAKATRTVRTIDLGAPDTWTSGHVEGERTELRSEDAAGSGSDSDRSDARRPAVGD